MHYKTVVKCYHEMVNEDQFCEDVAELLFDEFKSSTDLTETERVIILGSIKEWQENINRPDCLAKIKGILSKKEGFEEELKNYVLHIMRGGKKEIF